MIRDVHANGQLAVQTGRRRRGNARFLKIDDDGLIEPVQHLFGHHVMRPVAEAAYACLDRRQPLKLGCIIDPAGQNESIPGENDLIGFRFFN